MESFCQLCNKVIQVKDERNPVEWSEHIRTPEHYASAGAEYEMSGDEFKNLIEYVERTPVAPTMDEIKKWTSLMVQYDVLMLSGGSYTISKNFVQYIKKQVEKNHDYEKSLSDFLYKKMMLSNERDIYFIAEIISEFDLESRVSA